MLVPVSLTVLDDIVERTLLEDVAAGDLTTDATVVSETRGQAVAIAKGEQVVCGSFVAERVFKRIDPGLIFEALSDEARLIAPGAELWRVRGAARSLLLAERSALNLVQRLGGVATLTRAFVAALPAGSHTRIADTRKTTPGLRALERYAVRTGGGHNHRDNLGSAVLIKDNHITAAGGVAQALSRARQYAPHTTRLEVEVETLSSLDEALSAGADIVMLDNFKHDEIAEAVRRCRGRALVEVSGNVGLERVAELAHLGVDVISVGALTHSVKAADISLKLRLEG